jgi:hypothetical protein
MATVYVVTAGSGDTYRICPPVGAFVGRRGFPRLPFLDLNRLHRRDAVALGELVGPLAVQVDPLDAVLCGEVGGYAAEGRSPTSAFCLALYRVNANRRQRFSPGWSRIGVRGPGLNQSVMRAYLAGGVRAALIASRTSPALAT